MSSPATITMTGELNIADAAALHARLLADVAACPDGLCLDLGAVEGCDSAGVQLLLALRHTLAARGQPLRIVAASAPLRQTLATYGLIDLLPTREAVPAEACS